MLDADFSRWRRRHVRRLGRHRRYQDRTGHRRDGDPHPDRPVGPGGGTLSEFIYLEHGAHYGIGALALLMLASTPHPIPELATGLVGVGFILAALAASIIHNRGLARR